jgi:hypothetical protein
MLFASDMAREIVETLSWLRSLSCGRFNAWINQIIYAEYV